MFESLKLSFSEAHWVVITILGLYTWFINKQSASAKEMLDIRLRVTELESTVKDMPSKVEIEKLQGQLNGLNHQVEGVQRGVTRIENYLLDKKK